MVIGQLIWFSDGLGYPNPRFWVSGKLGHIALQIFVVTTRQWKPYCCDNDNNNDNEKP